MSSVVFLCKFSKFRFFHPAFKYLFLVYIFERSFIKWWTILPPTYKIFLILVILSVALVGYIYVQKLLDTSTLNRINHTSKFIPNPEVNQPASSSILHQFKNSAVCSDSRVCSEIGRLVGPGFNVGFLRNKYANFRKKKNVKLTNIFWSSYGVFVLQNLFVYGARIPI